jgi:hypothetical protein
MAAEESEALKKALGSDYEAYPGGASTIHLGDAHLLVYLPWRYPEGQPPEVTVSFKASPPFTDAELQAALVDLWEGSERSPVLMDLVEWVRGRQAAASAPGDGGADCGEVAPDPDRDLVIYTWGDHMRSGPPPESQKNFNAKCLNCRGGGVDLRTMNGTWPALQAKMKACSTFPWFRQCFIRAVEDGDLTAVSVNCSKGRHRCVSFAEVMREDYPRLVVRHLALKVTTSRGDLHACTKNKKSRK